MTPYYDAHCHYYSLKKKYENFVIAAVSDDYSSSLETLSLKDKNVLVGVAIHPWNVHREKLEPVLKLIPKADFIGEVGLDYRLAQAPKDMQIEYFTKFLQESQGKLINVHALDAWKDALDLLIKYDVKRAILHWYSGPIELLKDIEGAGYFITVNPSVTFQKKHQRVVENAPLKIILTESDGGYEYRGRLLEPIHIPEAIDFLEKIKNIEKEKILKIIEENFKKAFNFSDP
ncbi:MAG: TatD family hydrolase [Sulfolobaceae archaeon]|nr:TatD family hydrolase [Sulfolobaceae archaeon]